MLGKYKLNQIYNEDCYEALKNIPDKSVDLIVTDPPYDFHCGAIQNTGLFKSRKGIGHQSEIMKLNINNGYDMKILNELVRIMKKVNIYIWCNKTQIKDYLEFFDDENITYTFISWHKTNCTPLTRNTFLPDTEYCLYFRQKGILLNDGYDLKHTYYISSSNSKDKDLYEHPTIKPLELVKRHILHSTQPNDIVLDCFLGSGTTCVAAKKTGRRYIGFEIDPTYYQIAQDRLNNISQQTRKQIDSGQMTIFDMLDN